MRCRIVPAVLGLGLFAAMPTRAADSPGFTILSAPRVCSAMKSAAAAFDLAYESRRVETILAKGDKYLTALRVCDIALLDAAEDFPTSSYLDGQRTRFNLLEASVSLKLGFTALRGKRQRIAKAYFLDANKTASYVGESADTADRALALDLMKKSKTEADQLEKDGY